MTLRTENYIFQLITVKATAMGGYNETTFDRLHVNIGAIVSSVVKPYVVAVTADLFLCSSPSRAQNSSVVLLP